MFKELLLQFILSLLPVFAFQIWHDKEQCWKGMSIFMGIFCGMSMVLCMLTATNVFGYEVDFRLIPYLIGSLYGGLPALAALTFIYIGMRIPMLDSGWETVSFILFIVGYVPLILFSIRSFGRASVIRKKSKAIFLMSVLMLYCIMTTSGYVSFSGAPWSIMLTVSIVLAAAATLSATWLSVFMIESVKEKQLLHIEVKRLSANYRDEVEKLQDEVGRMERLSLVGQMAASITHEIRNPMAVIRGFVQLIKERSPKNQQEYFRIIMEELDRANMIISDFLSLAQNRTLTMEPSSLHDIIKELIPLLNADANMRGQTIEVSLCKDLPLIMLNDREIKQLFLNISRNGMEAMSEKGSLRISTSYFGGKIELRIADQGVGIPTEQMKHLFEPFFSTKSQGTGLGLPLCLSIAERHNGRIDVESKEGEGTAFIVTFFLPEEKAS